ncbi:hypothetical protein [Pantoea agglomerans]|uniref:hypothetical protein n=1 Tax=Enterobacter agglomerans TaxID=549 RepID=UPI003016ECD5
MLDKIKFYGFDVKSSSLTISDDDSEGGRFKITFSGHEVSPQNDEDGNWLFIEVTPTAIGYSNATADGEEDEEEAFKAEATILLSFQCNFEEEVSEASYNDNQWFFDNYVFLCTKIVFEKMFSNTVLNTIDLPWSPKVKYVASES